MNLRSNHIRDCKLYYAKKLSEKFTEDESLFMLYWLFEAFFNIRKDQILAQDDIYLSESEILKIHYAVKDLLVDKPIQYIVGEVEFCDLILEVNQNVLIPRPETEELVEMIRNDLLSKFPKNILDVGTGSGCIALGLKKYFPQSDVTAIDFSEAVLSVAKNNARKNNLKINFLQLDFLKEQQHIDQYDLIVSNPPYVTSEDKSKMHNNVLNFEPESALFVPDENPLLFYKAIIDFSLDHLNLNGKIFCEINQQYGEELKELFTFNGFKDVHLYHDFKDVPRFLSCIKL